MARVVDQRPVVSKEPEVHAPRVDANSVQLDLAVVPADMQRMPDLMKKPQRVPVQPGWQTHRRIWETVELLQRETLPVEYAEHRAAALGSQVDGQEFVDQSTTLAEITRIRASPLLSIAAFPMATFWPALTSTSVLMFMFRYREELSGTPVDKRSPLSCMVSSATTAFRTLNWTLAPGVGPLGKGSDPFEFAGLLFSFVRRLIVSST